MAQRQQQSRTEQQIDENLRKVYRQEAEKEMPERFLKLLQQLKEQEASDDR